MNIATQLFNKAFHSTRDPRSAAYKAGVLDTLTFKESGAELKHPFEPGTAESDAWIAGNQEGHSLWRDSQQESSPSFRESRCYVDHQSGSEDILSERISQLKSLLTTLTGEGFDSFIRHNDDIQQNVLWLCYAMVDDIHWHFHHEDEHLKEDERNGK
jgi:hypothetical protein